VSPRGAALIAAVIVIACAVVAAVAIGIPWPFAAAGAVITLGVALRLVVRWRREVPPVRQ
jgi:hypothetical protein